MVGKCKYIALRAYKSIMLYEYKYIMLCNYKSIVLFKCKYIMRIRNLSFSVSIS